MQRARDRRSIYRSRWEASRRPRSAERGRRPVPPGNLGAHGGRESANRTARGRSHEHDEPRPGGLPRRRSWHGAADGLSGVTQCRLGPGRECHQIVAAAHRSRRRQSPDATSRRCSRSGSGCPTRGSRSAACTWRCAADGVNDVQVSATVTNVGKRAGADVAQLYLGDPASTGEPPRQLVGFQRVELDPGRSARVQFTITPRDNGGGTTGPAAGRDAGLYRVYVGDSSAWPTCRCATRSRSRRRPALGRCTSTRRAR